MKVKLMRDARIHHSAGEIVEVSPAEAGFLISTGSAAPMMVPPVMETPEDGRTETEVRKETVKKPAAKKPAKK